ncbi:interleukin-2 receptor subunit alpha isoform X1 [Chelonia mydas]|uniref:interleukin-2 receptor subunit alpha isoform X1 n=1 Tax=Chelonia mydas TaxID=8469 RepID=UPI0018A21ACD|nr:interleukin-2 receptor subunit alpha isoform X1 [Chelonia mydas]
MELIFLLLWAMLRSGEATGHGNGKCPVPHYIEFAEITIDRVMLGSKGRYKCEDGYKRTIGESNLIVCINDTGLIHWTTKTSVCTRVSMATSQQSERKPQSSAPENPVTIVPSDTAGYCGIPSPVEHATPTMTHYAVGQELHYKCLRGYDARPPTSDISTCKEESGKIFWTKLNLLCTNDSKSGEEMTQPIPITDTSEPSHVPPVMLHVCTATSELSHVPSVMLPVTVAVSTVFPIIFILLGWIIIPKLWRRRSFTEEVKTEKTKSILITAARVEMESEVEAHRLKSNM